MKPKALFALLALACLLIAPVTAQSMDEDKMDDMEEDHMDGMHEDEDAPGVGAILLVGALAGVALLARRT